MKTEPTYVIMDKIIHLGGISMNIDSDASVLNQPIRIEYLQMILTKYRH